MKKHLTNILLILCLISPLAPTLTQSLAQEVKPESEKEEKPVITSDYRPLMDQKKFKDAINVISERLKKIYSERIETTRIPTDFITLSSAEEGIDLNKLFRERKAKLFFIEENKELYTLHFDIGRAYYETKQYDKALNNYYQALRFRTLQEEKDDAIFYQIAWAYKQQGNLLAYYHSLETAYELNSYKFDYSLELGKELYRTKQKKKAIYHLQRYIESKGDNVTDIKIYIMIANLNEDIHRYLETAKYYQIYLKKKPDDAYILFALGFIAFKHIGNYPLARESLQKSLTLLKDKEIFRKSKVYEYVADMEYQDLKFKEAITAYLETIKYQEMIAKEIEDLDNKIKKIDTDIKLMKKSLLREKDYIKYNEYQLQVQELEQLKYAKIQKDYEYRKLNSGKIRWNLAQAYEKLENYKQAIIYYREAISFTYKPNKSREKIIKLKLKIKRGY